MTDDEIIAAGGRLVAAGKRVSGWALREALGDRGRANRLEAVWLRHVAAQAGDMPEPNGEARPLPPPVEAQLAEMQSRLAGLLSTAVHAIYKDVDATVAARYQAERDQLAETRAAYEEQMAGAAAAIDRSDDRIADLAEQLEVRERDAAALRERLVRQEERQRSVEDKAATESARMAAVIADLTVRTKSVDEDRAQLRHANGELAGQLSALAAEADRLRAVLEEARADATATRNNLVTALVEAGAMRGQLDEVRQMAAQQQAEAGAEIARLRDLLSTLTIDLRLGISLAVTAIDALHADHPLVRHLLDMGTEEGARARHILTNHAPPQVREALERLGLNGAGHPAAEAAATAARRRGKRDA
ncbi:MAG: hypothetical protein ACM31L_07870 [Actinomycetota bacterium]